VTPKLSTVDTIAVPNRCCQTRLTATRGASGLLGLVSHPASSSRPLWAGLTGFASGTVNAERNPRGATGPSCSATPRTRTSVSPTALASRTPWAAAPCWAGSVRASNSPWSRSYLSRTGRCVGWPFGPGLSPAGVPRISSHLAFASATCAVSLATFSGSAAGRSPLSLSRFAGT
jgi:hypothetical protein